MCLLLVPSMEKRRAPHPALLAAAAGFALAAAARRQAPLRPSLRARGLRGGAAAAQPGSAPCLRRPRPAGARAQAGLGLLLQQAWGLREGPVLRSAAARGARGANCRAPPPLTLARAQTAPPSSARLAPRAAPIPLAGARGGPCAPNALRGGGSAAGGGRAQRGQQQGAGRRAGLRRSFALATRAGGVRWAEEGGKESFVHQGWFYMQERERGAPFGPPELGRVQRGKGRAGAIPSWA